MKFPTFQLTRFFFMLTISILVVFGVGSLLQINTNSNGSGLFTFYALLMFADAAGMAICAVWLNQRTRPAFFFSTFLLTLNILLSIFDQFGLADLLFVILNLLTLVFLIRSRREFLPA